MLSETKATVISVPKSFPPASSSNSKGNSDGKHESDCLKSGSLDKVNAPAPEMKRRSKYDRYRTTNLKKITMELSNQKTHLTADQISNARDVFYVWGKRVKYTPNCGRSGCEMMHMLLKSLAVREECEDIDVGWFMYGMDACGKSCEARRSQQIMEDLIQLHADTGLERLMPDVNCYNVLIDAWSRSKEKGAAEKAESILNDMIRNIVEQADHTNAGASGDKILPNTTSFNNAMNVWVKTTNDKCGTQAEAIFREMVELYEGGFEQVKPNISTYNILISSWANSMTGDSFLNAERIFHELEHAIDAGLDVEPDNYTFSSMLMALANSGVKDITGAADKLISRIEALSEEGKYDVRFDTVMYNSLLNVWLRSNQPTASDRGMKIVERMEKEYNRGDVDARPDSVTYNILMNIYANADMDGSRAEEVLLKMEKLAHVHPDVISYNTVLNAWKLSGNARKAQMMLDMMEANLDSRGRRKVKPDAISYQTVMCAWASSKEIYAAENAEAILERMDTRFREGYRQLKPTLQSYNIVLNSFSKSRSGDGKSCELHQ